MTTRRFEEDAKTFSARGRPATRLVGLLLLTTSAFLLGGCGDEVGAGDDLDEQVSSRWRRRSP